jgi:hypothetical protein
VLGAELAFAQALEGHAIVAIAVNGLRHIKEPIALDQIDSNVAQRNRVR